MFKKLGTKTIIYNTNTLNRILYNYCTKVKVNNKSKQEIVVNNKNGFNLNVNNNNKKIFIKKDNQYIVKDKHYKSYNESWFDFEGFERIPVISSGVISLDYQLKIGGIPLNHITEIYGDSSTGKSTLSMFILSNLNNKNKNNNVLYIDSENSFNSDWAHKIGVNLSKCTVFQPNNSEEAFELIKESLRNNLFKVIILDSLSSLMSINDIETNLLEDSSNKGNNHGLEWISSNLKEISELIRKTNCSFIFTNQMRYSFNKDDKDDEDIDSKNSNSSIGNNNFYLTSFANSTLNKYVDIAIELKKDRFLVDDCNKIVGIKTFLNIQKNRLSIHDTLDDGITTINNQLYQKQLSKFQAFIDINFENGILKENETNNIKKELNLISNSNNNNNLINILFNK